MDRRRFVSLLGTAFLAGCGAALEGGETDGPPTQTTTPAGSSDKTASATPSPSEQVAGTPTAIHAGYATTEVVVRTPAGERLGSVVAAVADTPDLRYRGLSETPSLPEDRGMLFAFDGAADRTFVMRGMSFGIDVVYADTDGTITRIHHAPAPGPETDGSEQQYPGYGQYVLEVNRGWTTDRGVTVGDVLEFG